MIDLTPLPQPRFHVLGYGVSGIAAAFALRNAGKQVVLWDDNPAKRIQAQEEGFEVAQDLSGEALVVSPGIMVREEAAHPLVAQARKTGAKLTNDMGLFREVLPNKKLVAITGTNGKSTTTALIGHILTEAGTNVAVGGNLGTPVLSLNGKADIFVLELSSYQLETAPGLHADIAVLINLTSDHIDHHGTMEAYKAAKMRIFENAKTSIRAEELDYRSGHIGGFDLTKLDRLRGEHNWQNIAAAFAVCRKLGVQDDAIWRGVQSYPGLPHRQFFVRRIGEIEFINDSKATNADAAQKALRSFSDIYWIAGGRPKEGGLSGLEKDFGAVREVFLIGEAQQDFALWLSRKNVPHRLCGTLDKAVSQAYETARGKGHATVLLSPACASFDQFDNFPQRGEMFENLVRAL